MITLGRTIKLFRISAGWRQTDLAAKLKVSSNYLSLLENNKREPSLSFLQEMANVFDVPLGLMFIDTIDTSWFLEAPGRRPYHERIRSLLLDIWNLEKGAKDAKDISVP